MSEENVEICRRVAELLGGDNPSARVHAALEYADPEIVFESAVVSRAEGGTYRGHDGLRAWAADHEAAFDEARTTPYTFLDDGEVDAEVRAPPRRLPGDGQPDPRPGRGRTSARLTQ